MNLIPVIQRLATLLVFVLFLFFMYTDIFSFVTKPCLIYVQSL